MKKQWILAVAALLSLASCGSYKKLTYLQDMEVLTTYDVKEQPNVLIGVNDKLRIVVTCQEPTLAAPFNLSTGVFSRPKPNRVTWSTRTATSTSR